MCSQSTSRRKRKIRLTRISEIVEQSKLAEQDIRVIIRQLLKLKGVSMVMVDETDKVTGVPTGA